MTLSETLSGASVIKLKGYDGNTLVPITTSDVCYVLDADNSETNIKDYIDNTVLNTVDDTVNALRE